MKLIIYIPALNEEKDIQQVIQNLPRALDKIDDIQYLVVDDGSTDNTSTVALASGAHVVSHGRNKGVGAAFHTAVQFALENQADILVSIDADGQFDPVEIPNLVSPIIANKADMVIGRRFASGMPEHMSRIKYWGNKQVSKIISYVSGQKFTDVSCGYRAYGREALLKLNLFGLFTYTHEAILSVLFQDLRVMEHPVSVKYDPGRKSRVAPSIFRYAWQTAKIILRVLLDYRPLQVFGSLGMIFILIGSGFEVFLLGHYFLTHSFSPYKNTGFIGLGFFIFGMLVLLIALVADMLNRIKINQDRQLYEIKKIRYKN